jgi:hypothetical protein
MEREIITRPGTPLFVRPLYDDGGWAPTLMDYGVLVDRRRRFSRRQEPRWTWPVYLMRTGQAHE